MRLVVLLAVVVVGCGESRQEAAARIGEIDINPRKTLATLTKTIPAKAEVAASKQGLVRLHFGAGRGHPPLLELWFHSASRDVAAAARPITVIARHPFRGSILGVRPGDSYQDAWKAVRQRLPRVPPDYETGKLPASPPGGWNIPLEGGYLAWRPRSPQVASAAATPEGGELRFVDRRYSIHEEVGGVTVHTSRPDSPVPVVAAGLFPFVLRPEIVAPSRLLVDGKVVLEPGDSSSIPREIPLASASEDGPAITAKIPLPCGWRETRVFEHLRSMPRVGPDGRFTEPGVLKVAIPGLFPHNSFIVDNRRRPESTLKQGELTRVIAADSKESVWLPAPDCDSAANLELDGKVISKLPVPAADAGEKLTRYLLDPTGSRCYQFKTVLYGTPLNLHGDRDPPKRLSAQHLHPLPGEVHHIFEKAPDRITVHGIGVFSGSRNQLTDLSCP